jgi:hypothetical protein
MNVLDTVLANYSTSKNIAEIATNYLFTGD